MLGGNTNISEKALKERETWRSYLEVWLFKVQNLFPANVHLALLLFTSGPCHESILRNKLEPHIITSGYGPPFKMTLHRPPKNRLEASLYLHVRMHMYHEF